MGEDAPELGDEESRLSRRGRRYVSVGRQVGGFAAGYALRRLIGRDLDKGAQAEALTQALGGLKGPLMKAAQILGTIPDALPQEYADALRRLQANAPPMGWTFVRRRMRGELGADWQNRFGSFSREAVHAASLGQVHAAEDLGGRRLACKLQYPDMASAVEADIRQLKLAFGIYRQYDRAIDTRDIHRELSARLREELDYEREARHMLLYRLMLAEQPGVAVPEPLRSLSTGRLLTMTWLEGQGFLAFLKAHEEAELRRQIAINMFRAWYVPFYDYGIIHGDPHLGNYTLQPDGKVNLLDFGCIRVFPPRFVWGVIELYRALEAEDPDRMAAAYEAWGFENLNKELLEVLNLWARFLYAPILEDREQSIVGEQGRYGAEVAGKVHKELKRLGGVRPPAEFVLMDRAAVGLGSVFLHLKARINWYRLFHELVGDFDRDRLAARQQAALQGVGLAPLAVDR
ncbi:MAG: AarF/ABC1/UbiB kinase family protein [Rhodospirillales bacterium]|nr:AarF/ABC1/UbiB kinase family protein [Rhodospirillales bacterium]